MNQHLTFMRNVLVNYLALLVYVTAKFSSTCISTYAVFGNMPSRICIPNSELT